ncbi:unnamed protein product [Urochloa decumbens]|uniref:Disease resistance protein RPM1 n=1 Tax=Urochloa decumbens TaxID=240449 RepID=A0ABC9BTH2_9POAL
MMGVTASALMGVMKPLLGKLSALLEEEHAVLKGASPKIAFLQDELSTMSTALDMVSESEEASPQVKEWMCQLRELSYDVEDCIEIFMLHLNQDVTCQGFIHKIINKVIALKARHRICNQINELMERALEISDRRKRYKLDTSPSCSKSVLIDPRLPSLFEEPNRLVGIDSQRDELIKWLTIIDGTDLDLQRKVISIVGLGGLGKTTLANQVLQSIKSRFDCTAFVSVSRTPDVNKILIDTFQQILRSCSPHPVDPQQNITLTNEDLCIKALEYPQLVKMIREYLQNKRYFIIIDDIWSKQAWKDIQCAFPHNNTASKIVVTTRIEDVANSCSFPHKDSVYPMKPLDADHSKRLFLKRIFDHEAVDFPQELKEVTDDILKKCGGLPLAIVNIASLLATKRPSKKEWERVRCSLGSALEQDVELEVVKKILFLSYYDLPHYLKICLLDLSMFPEDYEIDCLRLIRRWMVEGFIIEQRGESLEDTGENYINELVNRNMIQPVQIDYNGRPRAVRVHDIMHDLIILLSTKENFATILNAQRLAPSSNKIRRLSIHANCKERNVWQGTSVLSHVRSVSVFGDAKKIPPLTDFHVLRVLDLEDCSNLEDVRIESIGSLIHLRYLSIRNIRELPRQIGNLNHLQTLDLRKAKIVKMPGTVVQLRKLVHLYLPRGVTLPNGIGNMVSLEELSGFSVKSNSPELLLELGKLSKLKELHIDWYSNDGFTEEGRFMTNLVSSFCKLGEGNLQSLGISTKVPFFVNSLIDPWSPPPCKLQTFSVVGCSFSRLPRFMSSLSELSCLQIWVEQLGSEDMHVLKGLPGLLYLDLGIKESKEMHIVDRTGFQCLRVFYFGRWSGGLGVRFEEGALPRVETLGFGFTIRDTGSTHGVGFDFGINHLSNLKRLCVGIDCRGASTSEVEAAEDAIRKAAALLPKRPMPKFSRRRAN